MKTTEKPWDYGRQPLRNPVEEKLTSRPDCARCRKLTIRNEHCVCGAGHPLNPRECGAFSDASVERNYMPHYFLHPDLRR